MVFPKNGKVTDLSIFKVDSSEKLSVVVIQNPMLAHLGHYVCRANNSLGNDFKTVHLKGERTKEIIFHFMVMGIPVMV